MFILQVIGTVIILQHKLLIDQLVLSSAQSVLSFRIK